MALNRIIADSIADGTVVASDIADGTITLAKLQSGLLPPATANSAAAYANAAFATANTGTASGSYANSAFATANTGSASGSYANSAFASANLISGVNTTQNTNITNAGTYANSAFATANTGSASGSYANSAFAKANTAGVGTVTSVSGTNGLTGTVTSSGSLSIDTTFGNVGTYAVLAKFSSGQVFPGTTAAGSGLGYWSSGTTNNFFFEAQARRTGNVSTPGAGKSGFNSTTAVSGTWRSMSGSNGGGYNPCDNETAPGQGLWIRTA